MHQLNVGLGPQLGSSAPSPAAHAFAVPAYLRMREVMRITSLSRATLYRRIAARRFPAPVPLGGRACGWASIDIQAWIHDPDGYRAEPRTAS